MWIDPSRYVAHKRKNPLGKDSENKDVITNNRTEALNEIKQDLGIPKSQQPDSQQMVILREQYGNPIDSVVVQEHSLGHTFDDGVGNHALQCKTI